MKKNQVKTKMVNESIHLKDFTDEELEKMDNDYPTFDSDREEVDYNIQHAVWRIKTFVPNYEFGIDIKNPHDRRKKSMMMSNEAISEARDNLSHALQLVYEQGKIAGLKKAQGHFRELYQDR